MKYTAVATMNDSQIDIDCEWTVKWHLVVIPCIPATITPQLSITAGQTWV